MKFHINKTMKQILLVVVVLVLGFVMMNWLVSMRKPPLKKPTVVSGPLVEVHRVRRDDLTMKVTGHGTAEAKIQAAIVPQVSGRVVRVHSNMVCGGMIRSGQTIVQIERSDYELAVRRADAEREMAQATIATAKAQIADAKVRFKDVRDDYQRMVRLHAQNVANRREMEKSKKDMDIAKAQLDIAIASLSSAKANLSSAMVAFDQAKLDLKRTAVVLPFDAVVVRENVDPGQFITAGQSIGDVYGFGVMEIVVPLADSQLKWFDMTGNPAPEVQVKANFGGDARCWTGRAVRVEGEVDRTSRMVNVVVSVDISKAADRTLIPGTFVRASITGKTVKDIAVLPRLAVHGGDVVWLVQEGRLRVRKVEVIRRDRNLVYVSDGVVAGDVVITSHLDAVSDGMVVRIDETVADK